MSGCLDVSARRGGKCDSHLPPLRETLEGAVNEQGWPNAQMDDGGTGEGLLAGWVRGEGHTCMAAATSHVALD
jgi:hypothetical protein